MPTQRVLDLGFNHQCLNKTKTTTTKTCCSVRLEWADNPVTPISNHPRHSAQKRYGKHKLKRNQKATELYLHF